MSERHKITISPYGRSGIYITYHPRLGTISIGGWYDTMVGLESRTMTLREFFAELGITAGACLNAFEKGKSGE